MLVNHIEIIVLDANEAVLAQQYGATRLELVQNLNIGGVSPSYSIIKDVSQAVDIPVNVMLRPLQCKGFIYDRAQQLEIMRHLEFIRDNTNSSGIVFGAIKETGELDLPLLENIIANKGHLQLTFHRAIDSTRDLLASFRELLNYQEINYILTSGGEITAIDGAQKIKAMVQMQNDYCSKHNSHSHCQPLAGSGITAENVKWLVQATKVTQIHIGSGVRQNDNLDQSKFIELLGELVNF